MRVVVTGGRGFIGRCLVERLLLNGNQVRVLTRVKPVELWPSVETVSGDLTDPDTDLVALVNNADVVYHCAGEINRTTHMNSVHVGGTRRLIAAASGRIDKWIQLSSVGAYGTVNSGTVNEEQPEIPIGEYETTKTEADRLVMTAASSGAFCAAIIRPSNVYGPTMRNRSLFQLIRAVDRRLFFFIGRPGASANYIHVDNVVDALMLSAGAPCMDARVYIVSDHRNLEDFIGIIAESLGRNVPSLRVPDWIAMGAAYAGGWLPGFPLTLSRVSALTNRAVYSTYRIETELGYVPVMSMEEGLRQMVSAYQGKA